MVTMAMLRMATLLTSCLLTTSAAGQQPPPSAPEQHWAIRLGVRVAEVEQAVKTVDAVVLVPDAGAYLREVSRWSRVHGRWPVLIEDDRYAPMFIRRFHPKVVVRAGAGVPIEAGTLESALPAVVARFWGGADAGSVQGVFKAMNFVPPGLVVTSAHDPAWTAAVALAAARGQEIAFLDGSFGETNGALDRAGFEKLDTALRESLDATGRTYKALGDDVDAVTICRSMAMQTRGLGGSGDNQPIATTDALLRNADGSRSAIVSNIFGSEARCAYVAMCSLFLVPESVMLVNGYKGGPGWDDYDTPDAVRMLMEKGYTVSTQRGPDGGRRDWRTLGIGGLHTDLLAVNSSGNADFFDLLGERLTSMDVPVFNEPAAVHFIHSWSMTRPADPTTVGGRFIEQGAYAYVGSVREPQLNAFVTPRALADRWMNFVPFLVAARMWEGPYSKPWCINLYGDVLMLARPPSSLPSTRVAPEQQPAGTTDLREEAKRMIRATEDDHTGEDYRMAIRLTELLGEDAIACALWANAVKAEVADASAAAAIGPLFRRGNLRDFLDALSRLREIRETDRDLLWQFAAPRLGPGMDSELLALLQINLRRPRIDLDAKEITRILRQSQGQQAVDHFIDRILGGAVDAAMRQRLESIRKGG